MNLYRIDFVHCSPKDMEKGIKEYLLAENEEQVYNYIDEKFNHGLWKEKANYMKEEEHPEDRKFDIYDDDYNKIGEEDFKTHILRVKGMMNSDNASYDDAYYGVTHFGWEEVVKSVLPKAQSFLLESKIASIYEN